MFDRRGATSYIILREPILAATAAFSTVGQNHARLLSSQHPRPPQIISMARAYAKTPARRDFGKERFKRDILYGRVKALTTLRLCDTVLSSLLPRAVDQLIQATTMAPSPSTSPLEEHHQHEGEIEREATEMGEYDEVLRRDSLFTDASAQRPRASNATPNGVYFQSAGRSLAKLWQRQVSATVPHDACRDHFGTPTFLYARPAA